MGHIRLLIAAALITGTMQVSAADVTVSIFGEVFGGGFDGAMGTGTVTFDDALITGAGAESFSPNEGLTLEFTLFGQTFFETNDIDYSAEPSLDFFDGEIVALDFIVSEVTGDTLTDITQDGVFGFDMFDVAQSMGTGGELEIFGDIFVDETGVVPLPGALVLFAAGIGFLGGTGRLRARRA